MDAASSPLSASAFSQCFTDVRSLVPERTTFLLAPCLSLKSFFLSLLKAVTRRGFLCLWLVSFSFAVEKLRLLLCIFGYGGIEVSIFMCSRSESNKSWLPFYPITLCQGSKQ